MQFEFEKYFYDQEESGEVTNNRLSQQILKLYFSRPFSKFQPNGGYPIFIVAIKIITYHQLPCLHIQTKNYKSDIQQAFYCQHYQKNTTVDNTYIYIILNKQIFIVRIIHNPHKIIRIIEIIIQYSLLFKLQQIAQPMQDRIKTKLNVSNIAQITNIKLATLVKVQHYLYYQGNVSKLHYLSNVIRQYKGQSNNLCFDKLYMLKLINTTQVINVLTYQ
eukprot:TRINITY_DN7277_c0_g2_i2.p1 TRINITY_DN7277_c0_g2~~TRINITY_DN7277_c0_g2_i2.p1  ORF type:complete len:218 (+),score=-27.90 TRINITY_DN7277_c0_g2_i2:316-969(+)